MYRDIVLKQFRVDFSEIILPKRLEREAKRENSRNRLAFGIAANMDG